MTTHHPSTDSGVPDPARAPAAYRFWLERNPHKGEAKSRRVRHALDRAAEIERQHQDELRAELAREKKPD